MTAAQVEDFLSTASMDIRVTRKSEYWLLDVSTSIGGNNFFLTGADDSYWLRMNSYKVERVADRDRYYVKIDG